MIYVECKPDLVLVKALGIPKKQIVHAGNKAKVCNILRRNRNLKDSSGRFFVLEV